MNRVFHFTCNLSVNVSSSMIKGLKHAQMLVLKNEKITEISLKDAELVILKNNKIWNKCLFYEITFGRGKMS